MTESEEIETEPQNGQRAPTNTISEEESFTLNTRNQFIRNLNLDEIPEERPTFVYKLGYNVNPMIYYDAINDSIHEVAINNAPYIMDFASVRLKNKIFISGGYQLSTFKNLKSTYEIINFNSQPNQEASLLPKSDMLIEKNQHTLVALNNTCFFSLGGMNNSGFLDVVERYNYSLNDWRACPPLLQKIRYCGGCNANGKYLFVFGGVPQNSILNGTDEIQMLDIDHEELGWKHIEILNPEWNGLCKMASLQISNEYLLVFGGSKGLNDQNDCWYFSLVTNEMFKNKQGPGVDLRIRDRFFLTEPVLYKGEVFIFGSNNDLHKYTIEENQWRIQMQNKNIYEGKFSSEKVVEKGSPKIMICGFCIGILFILFFVCFGAYLLVSYFIF